jgi:hypothetical protein
MVGQRADRLLVHLVTLEVMGGKWKPITLHF